MVRVAETEAQRLLDRVWAAISDRRIPVDPILIALELGIDIYDAHMESDISGMLVSKRGRDPEILLNRSDSANRARFTCAHEIGHYVRRAGDDETFEYVDRRDAFSTTGTDPDEVFANQFAAALLMPEDEVRTRAAEGATAAALAWEFKVSVDAMTFRLRNLGLS